MSTPAFLSASERLINSTSPHLIGVRHHSPALAACMGQLLTAAAPDVVAIELPAEAKQWVQWIAHPQARAPLAWVASTAQGGQQAIYPFADFSPELVALRWAVANKVEVDCIDLPVSLRQESLFDDTPAPTASSPQSSLAALEQLTGGDSQEAWDRQVEAPAPGSTAEEIRRAALRHGWAIRKFSPPDAQSDRREQWMRARVGHHLHEGKRVSAVVGSFHAAALTDISPQPHVVEPTVESADGLLACVVAYDFRHLDPRSGYPSGIRDPLWQQSVVDSGLDPRTIEQSAARYITELCRHLRGQGHPAGPAEAAETLRIACDLAALRGYAAPARREVIEACTSVLAHGDVHGRGRAVARGLAEVFVGDRSGEVAPGTPQSPLRKAIQEDLRAARLPLKGKKELKLTPLRGGLDLQRHVLLRQLQVAEIPYGTAVEGATFRGGATIASQWNVHWTAVTDSSIEFAAARGMTSQQVATTTVISRLHEAIRQEHYDVPTLLNLTLDAADIASDQATQLALDTLAPMATTIGFTDAIQLLSGLQDIARGRLPGAQKLAQELRDQAGELYHQFLSAAVRELAGINGSIDPEDARSLVGLVTAGADHELRIRTALHTMVTSGSGLMQGAATGILLAAPGVQHREGDAAHQDDEWIASWLTATPEARKLLRPRIQGLVISAGAMMGVAPGVEKLIERVNTVADPDFVACLPALRGGFDALDQQQRSQLYADLAARYGHAQELVLSPDDALAAATYDQAARERLATLGLADVAFSPAERWRLILAQQRQSLSATGARMGKTLDELYGHPDDDSLAGNHKGQRYGGAGSGAATPAVRQWRDDIESFFGEEGTEEIFGEAAARGRSDVLLELDPEQVRPSMELLTTALNLAGSLPEAKLAKLRPLVARMVKELTEKLARQVRPALTGINSPRPTRRRGGKLNMNQTIRRNLSHVIELDGRPQIVPVTPIFSSRMQRSADWHLIIVVDVSGSMSQSVIFSAMMSAILAGVPALSVTFLAFNTEVIDFSDHADDPLALLLEVQIGGGTNITRAMRATREYVTVPSRTLCVLISDFEEWGSAQALADEIDALHQSGVHLLGCAALDDTGTAVYNTAVAQTVAGAGMRVAAVSPLQLAQWVGKVIGE